MSTNTSRLVSGARMAADEAVSITVLGILHVVSHSLGNSGEIDVHEEGGEEG